MPDQTKIQFVYFKGCPLADPARAALHEALDQLGLDCPVVEIDTTGGNVSGAMEKYPSPTILVDGMELFGPTEGEAACCRVYPAGSLEPASIARAIKSALAVK
jgi:hypothetical protein